MSGLLSRVERLQGRQDTLLKQKAQLLGEVNDLSELLSHDDSVMAILNELQETYSTSSVELYSDLLTSMVRGVIPDYTAEIVLEPGIFANKPVLDIYAVSNGQKEPIDDQGGSVSNLLAAGLRFIGLALSANRRIAILDESDCWLEGRLVPSFLLCIHELCIRLGLQVIFVSHHQSALDEVGIAKVRLKKRNGVTSVVQTDDAFIATTIAPDERVNAQAFDGVGFRYIRLQNYMAHEDSVIPLQPGLTAIIGDNNVGKSVITRAFNDLLTNNRNVNRIRRGEQDSSVRIGIEGGYEVLWQLSKSGKTGTSKGSYALLDAEGSVVQFTKDTTQVPDWLHGVMAMEPVNGLEMHIGHQKDPLFVLNPAISRHKRAELIQLGTEYDQINAMIRTHRSNMKGYRAQVKAHQASVERANQQLIPLKGIHLINDALTPVQYDVSRNIQLIDAFMKQNAPVQHEAACALIDSAVSLDIAGALNTTKLTSLQQYSNARRAYTAPVDSLVYMMDAAELARSSIESTEQTVTVMREFVTAERGQLALNALNVIHLSASIDEGHAEHNKIETFIEMQSRYSQEQADLESATSNLALLEQELTKSGQVCPTCKQSLHGGEQHASSHH